MLIIYFSSTIKHMFFKHFTNEEDFICSFSHYRKLSEFVDSISNTNCWLFKEAYLQDNDSYSIIFTSYKTSEYRNFLLSIHAEKVNEDYVFSITKQTTDLV